ncbi:DUF4398 domain-containing protein [Methylomicrobium sp. RS1]|nr:DUF4398 domain-containing protein [Methylomicrobium sp. RS1]
MLFKFKVRNMFKMNMFLRLGVLAAPASLTMALIGCSSTPPRDTLAKAEFAIQDAGRSGAEQFEPELLTSARAKLARANKAVDDDENDDARRLAQEAVAEATLANAKAAAAKQAKEVEDMKKAIEALKEESSRQIQGQ